jgi:hypothetical protein
MSDAPANPPPDIEWEEEDDPGFTLYTNGRIDYVQVETCGPGFMITAQLGGMRSAGSVELSLEDTRALRDALCRLLGDPTPGEMQEDFSADLREAGSRE